MAAEDCEKATQDVRILVEKVKTRVDSIEGRLDRMHDNISNKHEEHGVLFSKIAENKTAQTACKAEHAGIEGTRKDSKGAILGIIAIIVSACGAGILLVKSLLGHFTNHH